jgi:hypothetical protein
MSLLDKRPADLASFLSLEKSYDLTILMSVGLTVIGVLVAIYAVAVERGISPNELASMVAYP